MPRACLKHSSPVSRYLKLMSEILPAPVPWNCKLYTLSPQNHKEADLKKGTESLAEVHIFLTVPHPLALFKGVGWTVCHVPSKYASQSMLSAPGSQPEMPIAAAVRAQACPISSFPSPSPTSLNTSFLHLLPTAKSLQNASHCVSWKPRSLEPL